MRKIGFIILLTLTMTSIASGKVSIGKLDFSKNKTQGKLVISYDGDFGEYPELKVSNSSITVAIPDAAVRSSYDRRVNFANNSRDTRIRSFQFKKNIAHIKTTLPFDIKKLEHKVSLTIKDNKIELSFPRQKVSPKKFQANQALKDISKNKKAFAKSSIKFADSILDESYLAGLEKEQSQKSLTKRNKKVVQISPNKIESNKVLNKKDEVKTIMSAGSPTVKSGVKSSFSLLEYGGKFVAFLGVVLLLFYGLIVLMKKGVIKKGKLGFLNNTDQVQVVGQTFIAPKKSLMMIKAHNQVFLVSNTDSGIHLISEIKDASGYLKQGEKIIAGNNFDDNLDSAKNDESVPQKIKLKEDIALSNQKSALSNYKEIKEKVKFSDQLKKKVKNLKPLQ